jgi:flavorubredoxin
MSVSEIAPDLYRISVFFPEINMQFNHFLVKDDEPLLFHAGLRSMFPAVRHFESDECGALNDWLAIAPHAQPACNLVGALVSVNDFSIRPARMLTPADVLATGKYRFRYYSTPHLPHGWDAGVLFEETERTLLCSDLFHHNGEVEPLTENDILGRVRASLTQIQAGPLANYVPYTPNTRRILEGLATLQPRTLAVQHGSSFRGDCGQALRELAVVYKDVMGQESFKMASAS